MNDPDTFPFTNEQLNEAGLLGEGNGVSGYVAEVLKTMMEHPELLKLSLFTLQCIDNASHHNYISLPLSPKTRDTSTTSSALSIASNTMTVTPYDVSYWERTTYYHGISPDFPELLYRSDLLDNPFLKPVGRFHHKSSKTVYGVFNSALNAVWDTVAPQIRDLLKARNICYSAIQAARFVSHGEDNKDSIGPVVIWIATYPTTTTAKNAYDASPDILALIKANGVNGAVVEWYEGAIEKLSGPPLLRITSDINPTHYVRRFLTAGIGMPIATAEREDDDAQGSISLFFHENKDKYGDASTKVFGISNCHVLRKQTSVGYEFKGPNPIRQLVRVAGFHQFQRGLYEITKCISGHAINADLLARELAELKLMSDNPEEVVNTMATMEVKQTKLAKVKEDIDVLEKFYNEVTSQWGDIAHRNIGYVDWAPKIDIDIEGSHYTKDICTFELDARKFRPQFKGNVVDLGLGNKFTPWKLTRMFYPQSDGRTVFKFPYNRQLRINGCLTPELLANPDCFDKNGEPCLIVMKNGNTTDLTVGRYAGLEAYICDELGIESKELAIYNYYHYEKESGPFSGKGDSGSLIFDGMGHMVGILHSGMMKGGRSFVTYATPAWWAIEQIRLQYPHADFNREAF